MGSVSKLLVCDIHALQCIDGYASNGGGDGGTSGADGYPQENNKPPGYIRKQAREKGIVKSLKHSELNPDLPVVNNSTEAKDHYYAGDGALAQIRDESFREFESSEEFNEFVERVITGKTVSLNGRLSVDMT